MCYVLRQASVCASCSAGTYAAAGASVCANCTAGTYSGVGASTCPSCPLGTWSGNASINCTSCGQGTYSDTARASGQQACVLCPNGTSSAVRGASRVAQCEACAAGTYSGAGASRCSNCTANTYSLPDAAACLGCPAFSDAPAGATLSQCQCRPGYFTNRSVTPFVCVGCARGAYSLIHGVTACTSCPGGTYGNTSLGTTPASACAACQAGTYSLAQASACLTCPYGTYSSSSGSSGCPVCGPGAWSSPGASVCSYCPKGTYSTVVTALNDSVCQPCPSGTFSASMGLGNVSECTECPDGSSSLAGATVCSGCPVDTYSNPGSRGCLPCPPNSTSLSGSAADGCICDPGFLQFFRTKAVGGQESYSMNPYTGTVNKLHTFSAPGQLELFFDAFISMYCGSALLLSQVYFAPGMYVVPSGLVSQSISCASGITIVYEVSGEYAPTPSTLYFLCMPCSPGTFSASSSSDTCTQCLPGMYAARYGSTGCDNCPVGTISSPSSTSCGSCQPGMYPISASMCALCPAGTAGTDGQQCQPCLENSWASIGAESCSPCPDFSTSPGGTDYTGCSCGAGMYLDITERPIPCMACGAGTYSAAGATECLACPQGEYAPDPASTSCMGCPPGTYSTSTGGSACKACQTGYYSLGNSTLCTICPAGSYCTAAGSVMSCPPGTLADRPGLSTLQNCTQCPANFVCPDLQTKTPCPIHTSCSPGNTAVSACVCDTGFVCSYTKNLDAVVKIPISPQEFLALETSFIEAVAKAAGVLPSQVKINSISVVPPNRRTMKRGIQWITRVVMSVVGGTSLLTLDECLSQQGLPPTVQRPEVKRTRGIRVTRQPVALLRQDT